MIASCISLIIICSLICVGVYAATGFEGDEGFDGLNPEYQRQFPKPEPGNAMVLWWVRYYGGPILGRFWSKPVYSCLPCMGSLHSIIPTYLFIEWWWYKVDIQFWVFWPFVALATCGLNYLITVWWTK